MKKILVILATIIIIIAGAITYYQSYQPKREYLLHDFHQHTTRIQTISISQKDIQIELVNEGGAWYVIQGTSRTEANVLKIYQLFNMLEGLTILEKKTDDTARFETLGVDSAQGLRMVIKDVDAKIVADLIVGKLRRMSENAVSDQAFYIRKAEENQVWLVEGKLQVDMDIKLWEKANVEENK
jgi:hypothetical protein